MRTLLLTALLASTAYGQTSYPMLMSVHPVAAAVGTTSEHTLESRYDMFGTWKVLVSGEGVTGEPILPRVEEGKEPPSLTKMKVRLTIADDAEPGVREIRIATPRGLSTVGQIVIVRDPLAIDGEKNTTLETAQPVELPATICGKIKGNEEVDYYRFTVTEPTSLSFHVLCQRLQDKIHDLQQHADPILALRNASGTTVATNDNAFFADPFLAHRCEPGDYVLEIRDVRYTGNRYWTYAIECHARPVVHRVHPLAVHRGEPTSVELVGANLPDGTTGPATVDLPADTGLGPRRISFDVDGQRTNPAEVIVTDQPLHLETDADNDTPETAELVEVPAGINGRIERSTDVDCFAFEAKKGDRYTFEVLARPHGSTLDGNLRILDASGKSLAENDDAKLGSFTTSDPRIENWTVPADGRYVIEVRDLHLRGGADFVYHVAVTPTEPWFTLATDTDKTQLAPGLAAPLFVRIERGNGFEAAVQLHVEGLPAGVVAHCGRIPAGKKTDGCIILEAAEDAEISVADLVIRGTAVAEPDGREYDVVAESLQEIYMPGGGRGHWPVRTHTVHVGEPGDISAITLSTYDVTLKPGESARIDVEITRAEGFDKTVNLDVIFQHLSRVYGDSLPEGVTVDGAKSKPRLNGKETKGHLVLTADAKAPPIERRQVPVMANVALNFVMKSTCCAKPLYVTVEAPDTE